MDSASDSYDPDSDNDEEDNPCLNAFDLVQGQAPLYDDPDAVIGLTEKDKEMLISLNETVKT